MSDREWLRQIDEGWDGSDDEEAEVDLPIKKKGKGGRRPVGARETGTSGDQSAEPAKRGRKRKKVLEDEVIL